MSFYEDKLFEIFENENHVCISDDTDKYIQILMKKFTFKRDFIDWNKNVNDRISLRITCHDENFLKRNIVSNLNLIFLEKINKEDKIIYFNDNCFEQSLIFDNYTTLEKYLFQMTDNFVQRGYYMNPNADWCLLLRDTAIIEFGFSSLI